MGITKTLMNLVCDPSSPFRCTEPFSNRSFINGVHYGKTCCTVSFRLKMLTPPTPPLLTSKVIAGMEEMLTNFDKVVAADENHQNNKDADIRFTVLLQRKRGAVPVLSPSNAPHYPQPWFPASMETLEIADVQSMELARQISLHQGTLFSAIHPREYLQYCAERGGAKGSGWVTASGTPENHTLAEEVAPNLHAFARWSRALGRLVASDIVKHESKSKRVASLEKWIDVANNCLQLKNFDAVFNIMDGIRHPSIERCAILSFLYYDLLLL